MPTSRTTPVPAPTRRPQSPQEIALSVLLVALSGALLLMVAATRVLLLPFSLVLRS